MNIWADIKIGERWTDDDGVVHEEPEQVRRVLLTARKIDYMAELEFLDRAREQLDRMIKEREL